MGFKSFSFMVTEHTPGNVRSVLTPRIIRTKVEELFALQPGTLDTKEYKLALKNAASDEAVVRPTADFVFQQSSKCLCRLLAGRRRRG